MSALIIDTETTGHDEPHQFIEVAYGVLPQLGIPLAVKRWVSKRFNPGRASKLAAINTHHIHESELDGLPHPSEFQLPPCEYFIGHNIDFDHKVLGHPDVKLICTLALARYIWPNLDSHKLGALVYHVDREHGKILTKEAHSALADVKNTAMVLQAMLLDIQFKGDLQALWELSEEARIPKIMTFGKHKGTAIADLPADYKAWLLRQPTMDPYVKEAVRRGS